MAGMTDYAENKTLDHMLGTTTYTFVTQLYAALFTAAPSDAGGGTEVSGAGYARQTIDFGAASAGVAASSSAPSWTASGGNYGTVTHIALFDASSGGNMIYWAPLNVSRIVNNTDTFTLPVGSVTVSQD